ncbi:PREDICTED: PHD finger protein At3g20280-like [Camelina sativa]|uniref:PHD finger protein At3g20280-like n=1 Tax=Camelina sativa TaxID=90675 RepID=A0ABM0Z0K9_CAMSA|nr:PREDICTED: PHD finger protein At3g20280-like [Camelina sativa]XP_010508752.1 PREDICTED: PHD finger protein At3g20280-like [Camelina sativa]
MGDLESVLPTPMIEENELEPPAKRQRFSQDMNRVAEIVLVLSALGSMRVGDSPTDLELELMDEARSKLAGLCQEFTPDDILCKDDVKAVIEDLGLNAKLQDQRLGFRAPKLTISEKLSLGKRKMEEVKRYPSSTVSTGAALSQANGSVASPGLASKASVAHQWPNSNVNTSGSHLKMERPQMTINGASQGTPISSTNYYAAPWSAQSQSTISFSTGAPDKKVPIQNSVRVSDPSFRPFMSQTPHGTFPGTNLQKMHYGQTSSSGNNHIEIAKVIQKVLQPRIKQYSLWNPPSREYMSRAMPCQMRDVTIKEMDTLLICDACEKAYHLKCLPGNNIKGVPKSEWHCSRCVQAFNGKPFPPTYGRTIRAVTTTAAKVPSSTAGVQSSSAKKIGSMDIKVNQQKPIVTTTPRVQNSPGFVSGAATTSHFGTATVNANTTASAAKITNIGSQRCRESVISGADSPALVSRTETPKLTASACSSSVINNGPISKPLTSVGTMSSTSSLRVCKQVPVNATSSASPSAPITSSFVARAPTVTKNGDSSSAASETADHSVSKADLTTQVHTLTVTSSSNSQPALSHCEDAKATDDAALMRNVVYEPQAPLENVAECEKPSESTSHIDTLNAREKFASETCENHTTESLEAILSDQDSKITAEPSMPQAHAAYLSETTASQPPSVSSNYHSQIEKRTTNVQDSLQNVSGDSLDGKGLNDLDNRHQEQPSEPEFVKLDSAKEANAT